MALYKDDQLILSEIGFSVHDIESLDMRFNRKDHYLTSIEDYDDNDYLIAMSEDTYLKDSYEQIEDDIFDEAVLYFEDALDQFERVAPPMEEWIDPAGGVHEWDDDDPARMYE